LRIRHIEVFHAIYTTGSVTKAAKKLYVSQPSVSKVLGHAEQQLGFKLFDRIKGRLTPTKEADLLFTEVDQIYHQLINIKAAAENIRNNEVGRISIAATPALGFDVIPSAYVKFTKNHVNINFNIQTIHSSKSLSHLHKHQSDFAVLFSPKSIFGITETVLGYGEMVAVYSKEFVSHEPQSFSLTELLQYPLVSIWDSGPLADLVWHQMQKANLRPKSKVKAQTYYVAVNMVRYGSGICIVDEFTARGQRSAQVGIAKLPEIPKFPIKSLNLDNKPLSNLSSKFIEQLTTELAELPR